MYYGGREGEKLPLLHCVSQCIFTWSKSILPGFFRLLLCLPQSTYKSIRSANNQYCYVKKQQIRTLKNLALLRLFCASNNGVEDEGEKLGRVEKINNCQNCVSLLLRTECSSPNSQGIIEKLMFGLQTQYSDDGNSIFLKHSAMYNVASSIWCRDLSW